jgi:hypothetical protein
VYKLGKEIFLPVSLKLCVETRLSICLKIGVFMLLLVFV